MNQLTPSSRNEGSKPSESPVATRLRPRQVTGPLPHERPTPANNDSGPTVSDTEDTGSNSSDSDPPVTPTPRLVLSIPTPRIL